MWERGNGGGEDALVTKLEIGGLQNGGGRGGVWTLAVDSGWWTLQWTGRQTGGDWLLCAVLLLADMPMQLA